MILDDFINFLAYAALGYYVVKWLQHRREQLDKEQEDKKKKKEDK